VAVAAKQAAVVKPVAVARRYVVANLVEAVAVKLVVAASQLVDVAAAAATVDSLQDKPTIALAKAMSHGVPAQAPIAVTPVVALVASPVVPNRVAAVANQLVAAAVAVSRVAPRSIRAA